MRLVFRVSRDGLSYNFLSIINVMVKHDSGTFQDEERVKLASQVYIFSVIKDLMHSTHRQGTRLGSLGYHQLVSLVSDAETSSFILEWTLSRSWGRYST